MFEEIDREDSSSQGLILKDTQSDTELAQITFKPAILDSQHSLRRVEEHARVDQLSPALGLLPSLFTAAEAGSGKYFEVVISGDLTKAKGVEGGLRAFAMENGKISEHAVLFEPEKLTNIANFTVAFNALSVLVAQKHLADINHKLDGIKKRVDEIGLFQQEERNSKINYYLGKLRDIADFSFIESNSSQVKNVIVGCDQELGPIEAHLEVDIKKKLSDAVELGLTKDLKSELDFLFDQWQSCVEARSVSYALLSFYSNEKKWASTQFNSLIRESDNFSIALQELFSILKEKKSIRDNSVFGVTKKLFSPSNALQDAAATSHNDVKWVTTSLNSVFNTTRLVADTSKIKHGKLFLEVDGENLIPVMC